MGAFGEQRRAQLERGVGEAAGRTDAHDGALAGLHPGDGGGIGLAGLDGGEAAGDPVDAVRLAGVTLARHDDAGERSGLQRSKPASRKIASTKREQIVDRDRGVGHGGLSVGWLHKPAFNLYARSIIRGRTPPSIRFTEHDMTFTPHGKHLIAGEWVAGTSTFASTPAHGPAHDYSVGTPELVDRAVQAAEDAFDAYAATSRGARADFLDAIAEEIEARGAEITEIGTQETGLPEGRLEGERGRTAGQMRLFADHIRDGAYLDRRHDIAMPDRAPAPRPDLVMMQRPIGPIAVFGASNFPLAFSVAGGDTAAALAAGCPVVVKGHSAHPGTGEIVAAGTRRRARRHALRRLIAVGSDRKVGQAIVQHPLIKAVGFTGSLGGGRALFDLCAQRLSLSRFLVSWDRSTRVSARPPTRQRKWAQAGPNR